MWTFYFHKDWHWRQELAMKKARHQLTYCALSKPMCIAQWKETLMASTFSRMGIQKRESRIWISTSFLTFIGILSQESKSKKTHTHTHNTHNTYHPSRLTTNCWVCPAARTRQNPQLWYVCSFFSFTFIDGDGKMTGMKIWRLKRIEETIRGMSLDKNK